MAGGMSKLHPARLHALPAAFPAGLSGGMLGRFRLCRSQSAVRIVLSCRRGFGVLFLWLGNIHVSGKSEVDLLPHLKRYRLEAFAQAMLGDGLSGFRREQGDDGMKVLRLVVPVTGAMENGERDAVLGADDLFPATPRRRPERPNGGERPGRVLDFRPIRDERDERDDRGVLWRRRRRV